MKNITNPFSPQFSPYRVGIRTCSDYSPFGVELDGRTVSGGYRYGFQNQEKVDEISGEGNHAVAEFWEYDVLLSRRWNCDPVVKHHECPYATFANNPILIIDPNGADSIFYNQKGNETNRVKMKGVHTYFMIHNDGNLSIKGKNYFEGNSYASFFGDRKNSGMFNKVDTKTTKNDAAIAKLVNATVPSNETVSNFINESRNNKKYDYKNTVLSKNKNNSKTAYLFNGMLYNRNEMGNILWGATTGKLGMTDELVWIGSQSFTILDEGKTDEIGEQNAIFKGRLSYGVLQYVPGSLPNAWDYFVNGKRGKQKLVKTGAPYLNRTFLGDFHPGDDPTRKSEK